MQRTFDVLFSTFLLIILFPLFLILAIAVRIRMGSPFLFSQKRPGMHGKIFNFLKFRSMRIATDESGRSLPDDQRLTAFGIWMRRTSLDELPQLWNVFRGEMSLVGPRPLTVEYLSRYSPEQARRHNVRPGITGWAQVNGRNAISWPEKLRLDVWYVDHQTIGLYFKILFMTLLKVVRREGITPAGSLVVPEFMGTET